MAARNRSVGAGGAPAGPTNGANGQPVAVMYGLSQLQGQYVYTTVTSITPIISNAWYRLTYV